MARPALVPISLARIETRDGVWLDGAVAEPRRRRGLALVWVHGLGSVFSSGQPLMGELSRRLTRAGAGYFKFNTRGHGTAVSRGSRLFGAAFERFGDCVADIRAVIACARSAGYPRVVLAGHSTGANKVLHYLARTRDRRVAGLMLLGPVSDVAGEAKRLGWRELGRRVAIAERIARRDPRALIPREWGFWSARRYLSLYRPGGAEDVFPYYRPRARWPALASIRTPVAVLVGERDEFLDRPADDLVEAFAAHATRARSFTGLIVPGANHGFVGREAQLAARMLAWMRTRLP